MDIIDVIKDDHDRVNGLIEKIEDAAENFIEKQKLYSMLRGLLEAHTNAEERIVYEKLENTDEGADQMFDSYEEHKVIATLLQSLSELEVSNDQWPAKFLILKETIEGHVSEEESHILPLLQKLVSEEEREEMGDDMHSLEDDIISSGPETVTQTPAQTILGTNL